MKHLIKTAGQSGLAVVNYNRVILNTTTDNVIIDYSYVDLGLPSGLKWATRNIGATSESDYGDYFMWGSTTPNTASQCNWTNAPFNNGSDSFDGGYFISVKDDVCPNGILAKEYDAATQIMGDEWRMPTPSEIQELLDNTDNEWTQVKGVNGWKFTGSNGNSIFIPAAGVYNNGSALLEGSGGGVWSSSFYTSNPYYAQNLNFNADGSGIRNDIRSIGMSVRGVRA